MGSAALIEHPTYPEEIGRYPGRALHPGRRGSAAEGGPGDPAPTFAAVQAFSPETKSSMLRDAEAGRSIELDAIGGAVLRAARRHRLEAPQTAALVAALGGS